MSAGRRDFVRGVASVREGKAELCRIQLQKGKEGGYRSLLVMMVVDGWKKKMVSRFGVGSHGQ